ncbi:hypothetical protein [Burkholderia pyrrocinia]|uniref:hypothetical protein n=1 Tax=Burkholderia pyrrocinia TaxID=60550 RepID=UPI002AB306B2|nr:hypothetical protein [Burkholderia pyrrocinia]
MDDKLAFTLNPYEFFSHIYAKCSLIPDSTLGMLPPMPGSMVWEESLEKNGRPWHRREALRVPTCRKLSKHIAYSRHAPPAHSRAAATLITFDVSVSTYCESYGASDHAGRPDVAVEDGVPGRRADRR